MALRCAVPRFEAAVADGPLSAACPAGCGIVFTPGWFCDDCNRCVFPDMLLDADLEPDSDYS
jgi:hypothetical protein